MSILHRQSEYRPISESVDRNNIKIVEIEKRDEYAVCPKCGCSDVSRNGYKTRKLLDYADEPVIVKIRQQRYVCPNCGHKFPMPDADIPPGSTMTLSYEKYLLEKVFMNPDRPLSELAKECGSSASTMSRAVRKAADEYQQAFTIPPNCTRIIFTPFDYDGSLRCLISGALEYGDGKEHRAAFAVLKSYDSVHLKNFLGINSDVLPAVLASFDTTDEWMISLSLKEIASAEHIISPREVRKYLDESLLLTGTAIDNEYIIARNRLQKAIRANTQQNLHSEIEKIVQECTLSESLKQFCLFVDSHPNEITNASSYEPEEYSVTDITDIIATMKKKSQSFEEMAMRLLYFNDAAEIQQTPEVFFVANFANHKRPWHYVNIDKLKTCSF